MQFHLTEYPFMQLPVHTPYNYGRDRPIINPKLLSATYRPRSCTHPGYPQDEQLLPRPIWPPIQSPHDNQSTTQGKVTLSNNTYDAKADPSNSIKCLEVFRILGLLSAFRKSVIVSNVLGSINTPETCRQWIPRSSAEMKFLPAFWRFPPDVKYRKSIPGALETYSQRKFEIMVTAGYILEDGAGFHWTSNKKYLLFKETTSADQPQPAYYQSSSRAQYVHELFPQSPALEIQHSRPSSLKITQCLGERPITEKHSTKRVTPVTRPATPTPIVDNSEEHTTTQYPYSTKTKGVRINRRCASLDEKGLLREDEVADNEGKSEKLYMHGEKKPMRKLVMRGGRKYLIVV